MFFYIAKEGIIVIVPYMLSERKRDGTVRKVDDKQHCSILEAHFIKCKVERILW
jgi:hypothetical protein